MILRAAGGRIEFMAEPVLDAVVLRGSKPFIAAVLGAARGLKIIAKNGAGVDSVDLAEAERSGITVAVVPGANAGAVAEHAVAMMLTRVRDLHRLDRGLRAGRCEGASWLGETSAVRWSASLASAAPPAWRLRWACHT